MFCEKCNHELDGYQRYCKNCGNKVNSNQTYDKDSSATLLCIFSIIISICLIVASFFSAFLWPFLLLTLNAGPLIGLILMIIARKEYPNSAFALVLFWLYIVLILITSIIIYGIFGFIC